MGYHQELAQAKVNLTLHITGQRADGYHLLDSLVVFPQVGDLVEVEASRGLSLTIDGPFAQDLSNGDDNLVLRAAEMIRPSGKGAAIRLTKSLPVASGIGGGSADAAATLRALSALWDVTVTGAVSLGADVPVCLHNRSSVMAGIGDELKPVAGLPEFWVLLVNAGQAVSTRDVFNLLEQKTNPAMTPMAAHFPDLDEFIVWLELQRNDLEQAACRVDPTIRDVLGQIDTLKGCKLARMSGSGATCFGVFEAQELALEARRTLAAAHPFWWCVAAPVV